MDEKDVNEENGVMDELNNDKITLKPKTNEILSTNKDESKKEELKITETIKTTDIENESLDLTKFKLAAGVRTKLYDENGIPMDGYNYYQHLKEPGSGGPATFSFTAQYDKAPELAADIDLKPKEMTPEQLEVLAALDYEGNDQAYEELEEDFINTANAGLPCILQGHTIAPLIPKTKETISVVAMTDSIGKKGKDDLLKSVLKEPKYNKRKEKEIAKVKKEEEEEEEDDDDFEEDSDDMESEEEVEEEIGEKYAPSIPMDALDKEKIPFGEDTAMQNALDEDSLDSDIDFETEFSETTRDGETINNSVISPEVKSEKLTIIKETSTNKKKKKEYVYRRENTSNTINHSYKLSRV